VPAPTDRLEDAAMKYVLVTGGVVSGLGKGVTASSIGVLLKGCGLRITSIKIGKTAGGGARGGPAVRRRPNSQPPVN
jgi:hypothetical protein